MAESNDGVYRPLAEVLQTYLNGKLMSGEDPARVVCSEVGVDRSTLRRWRRGGPILGGEVAAKLAGFLAAVGLKSQEFARAKEAQTLIMMIGLRVTCFVEVLHKTGASRDALSRFLRGEGAMSAERMSEVKRICDERQPRLQERIMAVSRLRLVAPQDEGKPTNKFSEIVSKDIFSHQEIMAVAALQIQSLLPVLKMIESDCFSDEEREIFRNRVPNRGVFFLSTISARLCSQTARDRAIKLNQKGGE